jgi:hypothetical protein
VGIENVQSASCLIDTSVSSSCDADITIRNGIYNAVGSLRLDAERGVIRFSGDLVLAGLAHAKLSDTPVLPAY